MATGTLSKGRRVRRSEAEWRELFTRFDESDQTRERFCAEHDVVVSSFIRWWKKLRQSPRSQAAVVQGPMFVELTSEHEPRWDVELQLGAGVVLRLMRPGC